MINLLDIKPTTISRDLKKKYILIYGKPKVGKTTFAAQSENNLLLAFEKGYNALGGIHAVDITSWADFKTTLMQLRKQEVKDKYETVTIDTIKIAWDLCEKFICAQNGVSKIGDIPWGAGYKMCSEEFEKGLRDITMMGYGLIIIAHAKTTQIQVGESEEDVQIRIEPNIPNRPYDIVNQLVDIIAFIGTAFKENGEGKRTLFTRETPNIVAGTRFKYLPERIPFGYDELKKALTMAIEKEEQDGVTLTDHDVEQEKVLQVRPFDEIVTEAREIWEKLVGNNETKEQQENAVKILQEIKEVFGRELRLSDITEEQSELYELLLIELRKL